MKKRIISVVISAIAFITLMNSAKPIDTYYADDVLAKETTIETISEDILMGDVNGDGKVNSIDASLVLRAYANYSAGGEDILTAQQKIAADVNEDGKVDSLDASAILSYYSHLSTTNEPDTLTLKEHQVEMTAQTSSITKEKFYFKPNTHYVHKASCHWCNEDLGANETLEEIEDTNGIECRKCSECNPDLEIVNEYVEPVSNVTTSGVSEYDYALLCKIVASEYGGMADTYERAKIVAAVMNMVNDSRWPNTIEGVLDQSCAPWGFNKYAEYYCGGSIHYSAMSDAVDYYFNNSSTFAGWTCNQWWGDGQYNHFHTI